MIIMITWWGRKAWLIKNTKIQKYKKVQEYKIVTRWGKKVWFTEFARPTTRDPAMELEYMQVVICILVFLYFLYLVCFVEKDGCVPVIGDSCQ